jgi:hypothetical protein
MKKADYQKKSVKFAEGDSLLQIQLYNINNSPIYFGKLDEEE